MPPRPPATQLPNGASVPCPPGGVGCVQGLCPGVGHAACSGGSSSGDNNAFGLAFAAAGHAWTTALCQADSDGDGQTNGQELGDPCCVWRVGDAPQFAAASHPGVAASKLAAPPSTRNCASSAQPPAAASVFQPGEVQRSMTATMPGVALAAGTNYWVAAFSMPPEVGAGQPVHVVGYSLVANQTAYLHHWVAFVCAADYTVSTTNGGPYAQPAGPFAPMTPPDCEVLFPWAPGTDGYAMPPTAGFLLQRNTTGSLLMQVHYTNAGSAVGVVDWSSMTLHYTPTLRPNNLRVLWAGGISNLFGPCDASAMVTDPMTGATMCQAPAGAPLVFDSQACLVTGTAPAFALTSYLHAHIAGRRVWVDQFSYNASADAVVKVAELGRDDAYSFHNQRPLPVAGTVRPGDVVATTCVYDATGGPLVGGLASDQEMCIAFITVYPDTVTCNDPVANAGIISTAVGTFPVDGAGGALFTDARALVNHTAASQKLGVMAVPGLLKAAMAAAATNGTTAAMSAILAGALPAAPLPQDYEYVAVLPPIPAPPTATSSGALRTGAAKTTLPVLAAVMAALIAVRV